MPKSPYRFFTPLNRRRYALILKEHKGGGLSDDEARELEMLQTVCGAMVEYRHPDPMAGGLSADEAAVLEGAAWRDAK